MAEKNKKADTPPAPEATPASGPVYGVTTEPVPGGFVTRLRAWPRAVGREASDPGTPEPPASPDE